MPAEVLPMKAMMIIPMLAIALAACQSAQSPPLPPPKTRAEAEERAARTWCEELGFGYTGYDVSQYESAIGNCVNLRLREMRAGRPAPGIK
jgi:hypothetical protein